MSKVTEVEQQAAYMEGLEARISGCGIEENPYARGETINRSDWDSGWRDGEPVPKKELDQALALCRDLLGAANKCSEAPYYIVQPFVGIVQKHQKTISTHLLFD